MSRNTFYITTAIAYTNAPPHMGHAYEFILADVIARYQRNQGKDTFFLTGTDEHGTKILRAAQEKGVSPQVFVDEIAQLFKDLDKNLLVSNDGFVRTSDANKHWPSAQALWKVLEQSGDIYKGVYKGLYCVGCEQFLQEKELVDGKCSIHNKVPESIEEENYFFKLSRYKDQIKEIIQSGKVNIVPEARKNEMLSLLNDEAEDVSFSRLEDAVAWGVPVPGDSTQMMYVWCDALANYISALGYGTEDDVKFKTFWPADAHVVGKDILRFHAIIWIGMLLSAGLPLPKNILVHGFITRDGKKMSKSLGNGIDPVDLVREYGAEAVRYFFSREISPFEDGDFSEERFIESYNANLANGIGNLVSRTLAMADKYFGGTVTRKLIQDIPPRKTLETFSDSKKVEEPSMLYLIEHTYLPEYRAFMEKFEIHHAANVVWKLVQELDGYISDYEPYKLFKESPEKVENILWNLCVGISYISYMADPFIPETAEKIRGLFAINKGKPETPDVFHLGKLDAPLFPRIEKKTL